MKTCDACGGETDTRKRYRDDDDEILYVCPDCYLDLVPDRETTRKDREP